MGLKEWIKKAKEKAYEKAGEVTGRDPEEIREEVEGKTKAITDIVVDAGRTAGDSIAKTAGYDDIESLWGEINTKIEPYADEIKGRLNIKDYHVPFGKELPAKYADMELEPVGKTTIRTVSGKQFRKDITRYAKENGYDNPVAVTKLLSKSDDGTMEIEVEFYELPVEAEEKGGV